MNTRKLNEEFEALVALHEFSEHAYNEALKSLRNDFEANGYVGGCYV